MKHRLLIVMALFASILSPLLAQAQNNDAGWYIRGNAGYGIHADVDVTSEAGNVNDIGLTGDLESEGDGTWSVGVGYEFANNLRVELDGSSLFTDLGAVSQAPSSFGNLRTNALMVNALYDFDEFDRSGRFKPYIGVGLGAVESNVTLSAHDFVADQNGVSTLVDTPVCSFVSCEVRDSDINFAWQLIAGVGYDLTKNLTWDTQYRYLDRVGDLELDGTGANFAPGDPNFANAISSPFTATLDEVASHTVLTGLRYRFGGSAKPLPAPVPVPVAVFAPPAAVFECWDGTIAENLSSCPAQPAPQPLITCWDNSTAADVASCPSRPTVTCWDGSITYDQANCPVQTRSRETVQSLCSSSQRQETIYYELDKGQSPETRATINRILDIGQFCNVDNIRVIGHTDSSGSAAYNLGLSKRRAKDARDELVRQGIRAETITSEGKGESEPFIDQGDGVQQPLNRRTQVLISLSETSGGIN